jgi:hypothetical protein
MESQSVFEEILRLKFTEVVTSALLVAPLSSLVMGCKSGAVLICHDWETREVLPVLAVARAGGSGAVVSLSLQHFWWCGEFILAVYIVWESGHIAVMSLHSRDLIAFCRGPSYEDAKHTPQQLHSIAQFSCILDEHLNPCPEPTDFSIPMSNIAIDSSPQGSTEKSSLPSPFTPLSGLSVPKVPKPNVKKMGAAVIQYFKSLEQTIETGVKTLGKPPQPIDMRKMTAALKKITTDSPHESTSNQPPAIPVPSDGPRYLLRAVGNGIVTFDLTKFATSTGHGKFSSTESGAVTVQAISEQPLVAVQLVSYLEEAARAWADPVPCLLSVDSVGTARVASAKEQQLWFTSSILPVSAEHSNALSAASVLPNGDMFILENRTLIHSVYVSSKQYLHAQPSPVRSSPLVAVPPRSFQLKSGRESSATKTARKGLFGTGGTDLDRIFSKTMEQRRKDELLGNYDDDTDRADESQPDVPSTTTCDRTKKSAAKAKDAMAETREAFDERGDRAARLASKTESVQDAARSYKEQTAALRDHMKQREKRWGLF